MNRYRLLAIALLAAFSVSANALLLTASNSLYDGAAGGVQLTPGSVIQINGAIGIDLLTEEVYKEDGSESGILTSNYQTDFSNDEYWTISLSSGATATTIPQLYAFVKDGNNSPFWYLWDLTDLGWNGSDDIEFGDANNFLWPTQGSISHVSLFSGTGTSVSEPSSLALLGLGILGLGFYRKRNLK